MKDGFTVSIIIPCLNEEGNVAGLYDRLVSELGDGLAYEIIFVDDGSTDSTLEAIKRLAQRDARVRFVSFSRNFGHQMALKAGLERASGDVVISMDADMQHPPELIGKMLEKWKEGHDVVYTVRDDSSGVSGLFKRASSRLFYRALSWLADFKLEPGVADFRLLDRRVVEALKRIDESAPFYRGLMGWVGFKQAGLKYTPARRRFGATKYTFRKMMGLALQGITASSVRPLHLATVSGFTLSALAALYGLYAVSVYLFTDRAVSGWTSVLASVLFIGGFQLIVLGILGEYIGRIFIETRRRPGYIVRETNVEERREPMERHG